MYGGWPETRGCEKVAGRKGPFVRSLSPLLLHLIKKQRGWIYVTRSFAKESKFLQRKHLVYTYIYIIVKIPLKESRGIIEAIDTVVTWRMRG